MLVYQRVHVPSTKFHAIIVFFSSLLRLVASHCLTIAELLQRAMPVVPKKRSSAVGTTEAAGERLVFMGLFMLFVCSKTFVYIYIYYIYII